MGLLLGFLFNRNLIWADEGWWGSSNEQPSHCILSKLLPAANTLYRPKEQPYYIIRWKLLGHEVFWSTDFLIGRNERRISAYMDIQLNSISLIVLKRRMWLVSFLALNITNVKNMKAVMFIYCRSLLAAVVSIFSFNGWTFHPRPLFIKLIEWSSNDRL